MRHRGFAVVVGLIAATLAVAACEEEAGGGDPAVASAAAQQGEVVRTPADAATPFVLSKGLYKVAWATNDCTSLTVRLVGDNGYEREKSSTLPSFSFIATGVEDGNYTVEQTETGCSDWEVTIERVGG